MNEMQAALDGVVRAARNQWSAPEPSKANAELSDARDVVTALFASRLAFIESQARRIKYLEENIADLMEARDV
jgi:hypothetical protein